MAYNPPVDFEWDDEKNQINQQKHGVSFEEACGLFGPESDYLEIFDSKILTLKTASLRSAQSGVGSSWSSTPKEKKTSFESSALVWPTKTSNRSTARIWSKIDD
jgi:hypothetical protein